MRGHPERSEGSGRGKASPVTNKESYLFRAPQQFRALAEQVLPRLLPALAASRRLRVWSAGCARGEEPASLAMLLAEQRALSGWEWSILATDVDEAALDEARAGLYGERAVAQVPPPLAERWLCPRGRLVALAPELLARIDYRALDLARAPYPLDGGPFDLVLLRNVLIYFRRPLQRGVAREVARHLAPGGYLFCGATETLWQIDDGLESVDLGDCFAYRHRGTGEGAEEEKISGKEKEGRRASGEEGKGGGRAGYPPAAGQAGASHGGPFGVAVRGVPPRNASPAGPTAGSTSPGAAAGARATTPSPAFPTQQSFSSSDESAPLSVPSLALAVQSLAEDRLDAAAWHAAEAVYASPDDPAAHALQGFVHDLAGRTAAAAGAYRAALYLDPTLFQVRLLLADCLLRLGIEDRAEHHFREVLAVLDSGRARSLDALAAVPLPDRAGATHRSRQALRGRHRTAL